ncbi:hypothetical protein [Cupriavidus basilensis]|uniref:hypothetical protein n=1 Tax=Cupriavidus basilensis TaxID=68895 RepID=UPI00284B8622|nr:hypothetical protein [Cupriavidus basilensis]MDR3382322.1 hypothetical protein [Cupriavidus basilensis]
MFHDYYLRGVDRESTRAALFAAGLTVEHEENGEVRRVAADGVNISSVGTIFDGGEWDADGVEIVPPVARSGWHVNLRLERPLSAEEEALLSEMLVAPDPATPYRVWAE